MKEKAMKILKKRMMKKIFFLVLILFLMGCSVDSSSDTERKLASNKTIAAIFDKAEIKDLATIVDFFFEQICMIQGCEHNNVEACYQSFINRLKETEIIGNFEVKIPFHEQLRMYHQISEHTFNRIWAIVPCRNYNYTFALKSVHPKLNDKYFLFLKAFGKENPGVEAYIDPFERVGVFMPFFINYLHDYEHFDINDIRMRLVVAVHFLTINDEMNRIEKYYQNIGDSFPLYAYERRKAENEPLHIHPTVPEMVFVEGGTFLMGCTSGQNDCFDHITPAHQVVVNSFNIGKYPVTVGQFRKFVEATNYFTDAERKGSAAVPVITGWIYRSEASWRNPFIPQTENDPVILVSWNDVQHYIEWLNKETGKKFRLPTEAEWEFAARGGNKSKGYLYSGSDILDSVAWHYANSNKSSHPVGTKKPNELGMYDVTGNVSEWCQDWFSISYYSVSPSNNPQGPESGFHRVFRGGDWHSFDHHLWVTYRSADDPASQRPTLGFRLAAGM